MARDGRFWRNLTLIALAHVALIAGLIRWSLAARTAPEPESLVWLSGAEDLAAEKSESSAALPTKISVPSVESEPLKPHEKEKEQPSLTQAKSEIELSSPSPTPMPTSTTKPTATPAPKPKATPKAKPKSVPKPTPKKTQVAKASLKASPKPKPSPTKLAKKTKKAESKAEKKKIAKTAPAKDGSSSQAGAAKTGSAAKGSRESEFGWYGNMLHDRFYSAWIQPTTNVPTGTKFSALVKVRIEKDGRVSKFEIIKPSGNVVVNESVRVVAKQVTHVDPPPTGLIKGDHYDVKINFELNTNQQAED